MKEEFHLSSELVNDFNARVDKYNRRNRIRMSRQNNRGGDENLLQLLVFSPNETRLKKIEKIIVKDESGAKHDPFHFHVIFLDDKNSEFSITLDTFEVMGKNSPKSSSDMRNLKDFLGEEGRMITLIDAWVERNPNTHLHDSSRVDRAKSNWGSWSFLTFLTHSRSPFSPTFPPSRLIIINLKLYKKAIKNSKKHKKREKATKPSPFYYIRQKNISDKSC